MGPFPFFLEIMASLYSSKKKKRILAKLEPSYSIVYIEAY